MNFFLSFSLGKKQFLPSSVTSSTLGVSCHFLIYPLWQFETVELLLLLSFFLYFYFCRWLLFFLIALFSYCSLRHVHILSLMSFVNLMPAFQMVAPFLRFLTLNRKYVSTLLIKDYEPLNVSGTILVYISSCFRWHSITLLTHSRAVSDYCCLTLK